MTFQAVASKSKCMFIEKGVVFFFMAGDANALIEGCEADVVAVIASE